MTLMLSCGNPGIPTPGPESGKPTEEKNDFAIGADISWVTEMEDKGYGFYSASGEEMECTALMKALGFDAIRLRVWVNPAEKYNAVDDVVKKARRAQALGMRLMIDFHYSDSWADPGKQFVPAAWKGHSAAELASDVASHTEEVLTALKAAGVDVSWVQIGNEVTGGFLWDVCRVSGREASDFIKCFNSGAAAALKVYPDAKIILHTDNGWKAETLNWFYGLMKTGGARYDIIGLSLYPSYWENGAYPDWSPKTSRCLQNISSLHSAYGKKVMIVEFGMPASAPEKAKDALRYILEAAEELDCFCGLFLWEPESEKSRNGYDYGAFAGGKATEALAPVTNR